MTVVKEGMQLKVLSGGMVGRGVFLVASVGRVVVVVVVVVAVVRLVGCVVVDLVVYLDVVVLPLYTNC